MSNADIQRWDQGIDEIVNVPDNMLEVDDWDGESSPKRSRPPKLKLINLREQLLKKIKGSTIFGKMSEGWFSLVA